MRKLVSALVLCAALAPAGLAPVHAAPIALPSPTAAAAATSEQGCHFEVAVNGALLRTGPGHRYAAVGQLHRGDYVNVKTVRGSWYKVALNWTSKSGLTAGTTGWTHGSNLDRSTCSRLERTS